MGNPHFFEALFEKEFGVWRENAVFIAAVSGGADSTAMLTALSRLEKKRRYALHCLHIRHNIRPIEEGEEDVRFVRALCRHLEIPLRIVTIKPGKIAERAREKGSGIEAAAREYRQAAFRHEAARLGAEKIVTAHHKDDMLENTMMRMFRGSGPRGLASMPLSANLLHRPMINISRKQILSYLEDINQSYQVDNSNNDNHYVRNRVRNILVPVLDEHFPDWKKGIESLSLTQRYVAEYIEAEAERLLEWRTCGNGMETIGKNFDNLHTIIQEEAVFKGIEKLLNHFDNRKDAKQADCSRQYKVPRRSVLRRFFKSAQQSLDLGKIRLQRKDGKLQIVLWEDPLSVKGGAFCAEKPGSYQFMGYSINIDEKTVSKPSFYCNLPVIFRSPLIGEKILSKDSRNKKTKNVKNSIIVEDRSGKTVFFWLNQTDISILPLREYNTNDTIAVSVTPWGFQ